MDVLNLLSVVEGKTCYKSHLIKCVYALCYAKREE